MRYAADRIVDLRRYVVWRMWQNKRTIALRE